MEIEKIWCEALTDTISDLAEQAIYNVDLRELSSIGNNHEFAAAIQQRDLTSIVTSGEIADEEHGKTMQDLFQVVYQHAPAFDRFAHLSFIINFTWGVCRHLLRLSYENPTFSNKIKGLLHQVLGLAAQWQTEVSLYIDNVDLKHFVRCLFRCMLTLSAFARIPTWHSIWQWLFKTSTSAILHSYLLRELQRSVEHVGRALVRAAECAETSKGHHYASVNVSGQAKAHCGDVINIFMGIPAHLGAKSVDESVDVATNHIRSLTRKSQYLSVELSDNSQANLGDDFIDQMVRPFKMIIGEPSLLSWLHIDSTPERLPSLPVPGTCNRLLQALEWHLWSRKTSSAPLILTGPPGSGKSTLAYFVYRQLSETDNASSRAVLSYFFDAVLSPTSCTAQAFLVSILEQLYRGCPGPSQRAAYGILKHLQAFCQTIWDCPYPTLLRLVKRVLDDCPPDYLIVDGLDENIQEKESLQDFLMELSSRKDVAIMITCRDGANFDLLGRKTFNLQSQLHADLTSFVEHEINTKTRLNNPIYFELKQETVKAVSASATFLHAKLIIDILKRQNTPKQIRAKVKEYGRVLTEDLYKQLLLDSETRLPDPSEQLPRQKCILRLLVGTRETLLLKQIAEFLATDQSTTDFSEENLSIDIRQEIEELCGSFISISDSEEVTFFHNTAMTFFKSHASTTTDESNLDLTLRCLAVLSQKENKSIERITKLLRHHLMPSERPKESAGLLPCSEIYRYAALYFHEHVTAVVDPPPELLLKLNQFLQGIESVTWSEAVLDFKPGTGYAAQINVRASLSKWIRSLPPADQVEIKFDQFLEASYLQASDLLRNIAEDETFQFLPRIRLGDYRNAAAESESDLRKGYLQKEIVYDGLSKVLQRKDRFLLQARASLLQEYFWQKRFSDVLPELQELYKLQEEVIGQSGNEIFTTAWMIGAAWTALGAYQQAERVLLDTLEQVRLLRGKQDRFFNMLLLLDGQRLERVNDLETASANYDAALTAMTEIAGSQNVFVLTLKIALGAIMRKQRSYVEAEKLLFDGWSGRRKLSSINVNACFDGAMQLAALYRDKGDGAECRRLLDAIKDSTVRQDDFERECQFIHMDSLVAFDEGEYIVPKHTLMNLIDLASGKGRARNNRELLWIRIDLADAMRLHNEPDEATKLFSGLVVAHTSMTAIETQEEPKSLLQLAIAEEALRLVRKAKYAESERLLQNNKLRWRREADFYFLIQGGPTLDTSIIHPIRVPGMESRA